MRQRLHVPQRLAPVQAEGAEPPASRKRRQVRQASADLRAQRPELSERQHVRHSRAEVQVLYKGDLRAFDTKLSVKRP